MCVETVQEVGKGCWKGGVREKGHGGLERGWEGVETAPSSIISFPGHTLQSSILTALPRGPRFAGRKPLT